MSVVVDVELEEFSRSGVEDISWSLSSGVGTVVGSSLVSSAAGETVADDNFPDS